MKKTTNNRADAASVFASAVGLQDEKQARFAIAQLVAVGLRVLGADEGSLLVAVPGADKLRFAMVCGPDGMPPESGTALAMIGREMPIGEGITGMAALTRDVQTSSASSGGFRIDMHRVAGDGEPKAVLAAPLLLGDELVGVITAVSFDRRKTFSAEDARTYGMVANVAAAVIDQQRTLDAVAARAKAGGAGAGKPSGGEAAEERAMLEEALAFARSRPGRAAALRELLEVLSKLA